MSKSTISRSSAPSPLLHATRNALSQTVRAMICKELAARLIESLDFYHIAKQAHWNVRGPNFAALHALFDGIAGDADEWADLLAERIRQLGGEAIGDVRAVAALTPLPAYPTGTLSERDHVTAVADRLAQLAAAIAKSSDACDEHGDADAADICTQISRAADKWLWMVESHLAPS